MKGFLVTNKEWKQIQIPSGTSYLIPQDSSSYYYSETPQTEVDTPYKNNDVKTFGDVLTFIKKTSSTLYVLASNEEGRLILEEEICPM